MDGGGGRNLLWIKGVSIHGKTPCLDMSEQRKTALVPSGPWLRPLLVLQGLFTSSTASISPGCFGASWEVETISDQVDRC